MGTVRRYRYRIIYLAERRHAVMGCGVDMRPNGSRGRLTNILGNDKVLSIAVCNRTEERIRFWAVAGYGVVVRMTVNRPDEIRGFR